MNHCLHVGKKSFNKNITFFLEFIDFHWRWFHLNPCARLIWVNLLNFYHSQAIHQFILKYNLVQGQRNGALWPLRCVLLGWTFKWLSTQLRVAESLFVEYPVRTKFIELMNWILGWTMSLLNTQHYKVWIKGKVEQSRERSRALPYTLV